MSADKGKKDKKSKKDEVKYFSSSESSVTSQPTQLFSMDSASTPADLLTFEFPLDSPVAERLQSQEPPLEPQAASALISPKPFMSRDASVKSPRKQLKSSPPAKDASKDSSITPPKQIKSQSPSAMGNLQQQIKTFTSVKEEERCLLDSESSESSIDQLPDPPQQKTEPVAVDLADKRRSVSLPTEASPEVQQATSSDESKKRTKSEGQIKPSEKAGNLTPKKKSPLKKVIEKCGKVLSFMKVHDKQGKSKEATTDKCIPEESGDGKEQQNNPADTAVAGATASSFEQNITTGVAAPSIEQSVAVAAIESDAPMEELEQRNDPDLETPRRSRRLANLNTPDGASPSKKRDLKK